VIPHLRPGRRVWQVGRLAILGGILVFLQALLPVAHLALDDHHRSTVTVAEQHLQPAPSEDEACGLCVFFQGVGPQVGPDPPPRLVARIVPAVGLFGPQPVIGCRRPPDVRAGSPRGPPI
jgi:hypothetical protein